MKVAAILALACVTWPALACAHAPPWQDPSPHPVRFVEVAESVKLEVLDWGGEGRPLVFLAGSGHSAHFFAEAAAIIAFNTATRAFMERWSAKLKATVPDASIVDLSGARHYLLVREADMLREIRAFLASLPPLGARP